MPPAFNLKIYISIFHMQDFDALQGKSIIQLREIAKSLGIRSTTQMKKDEPYGPSSARAATNRSARPANPQNRSRKDSVS